MPVSPHAHHEVRSGYCCGDMSDASSSHPGSRRASRRRGKRRSDRGSAAERAESTQRLRQARSRTQLHIEYPDELPVSSRRDDIARAIKDNQVVVVAGETGSGTVSYTHLTLPTKA